MDMQTMTQIVPAWELHEQGLNNTHITNHLGRNRETIRLWLRSIQQHGLSAFLQQYPQAAKQPRPNQRQLMHRSRRQPVPHQQTSAPST
jgi:transposase